MRREIERRVRRLELQERGAGRLIIVFWPRGDVQQALSAHDIEECPDDLVIIMDNFTGSKESWVSVDGEKLDRKAS